MPRSLPPGREGHGPPGTRAACLSRHPRLCRAGRCGGGGAEGQPVRLFHAVRAAGDPAAAHEQGRAWRGRDAAAVALHHSTIAGPTAVDPRPAARPWLEADDPVALRDKRGPSHFVPVNFRDVATLIPRTPSRRTNTWTPTVSAALPATSAARPRKALAGLPATPRPRSAASSTRR